MGFFKGLAAINPLAVLGTGSQLAGSYMQYQGQKKQAAAQREAAMYNVNMQKEFAQKGIQWKVDDAKKAGISPLAALGAQTHSFSPVQVGSSDIAKESFLGAALNDMGQNMSRSLMAVSNQEERKRQILQTENLKLRNDKIKQDIVMDQQRNSHVRTSTPGNPPMANVEHVRSRITGQSSQKHMQAGAIPDLGFVNTGSGLAPVPSSDVKERIEDQMIPETRWALQNYLGPIFSDAQKPSKEEIKHNFPKAIDVKWNGYEWRPVYKNSKKWYEKPDKAMMNMY